MSCLCAFLFVAVVVVAVVVLVEDVLFPFVMFHTLDVEMFSFWCLIIPLWDGPRDMCGMTQKFLNIYSFMKGI